ncbi:replication initiation protein [Aggregatibacter actinomycetemcomitans]|uniref:replication initiation protein n=1 Tax=Aggregatibacter actinomycetemcomitans TaxID=714 RepID=UPI001E4F31C3|nr:replication initiation protein [Aggregatibacter actinomycetemcomitans]
MSELIVYKSNGLVVSRYDLTEQETKLISYGIAKLNPTLTNPTKEDRTAIIPYKEYAEFMGISDELSWHNLNNAISNLMSRTIEIVNPNPQAEISKIIFQWVNKAEFNQQNQSVELTFSEEIKPYLFNLNEFVKYKLVHIKSLNNKYSTRFYEILLKLLGEKGKVKADVELSLAEFKEMLVLDANYPTYKQFNQRILKMIVNDVNNNSNLNVSFTTKGRPVDTLVFSIEKQEQKKIIEEIATVEPKRKTHQQRLDEERITKTKYILDDHKAGKITLSEKEFDLLCNMYKHYYDNGSFSLQGKITSKVIEFFDSVLNKYLPRMPKRR